MSQEVQQEALIRLLIEKGIFTKEKLMEMVRVEDRMQEIVNELGLGESNPHAGKPAPQVPLTNQGFGLGNRTPRPMPDPTSSSDGCR